MERQADAAPSRPAASPPPRAASRFAIERHHDGPVMTVAVEGELDIATADQLRDALHAAFGERPETLVIDLASTSFIDSSGLSVLVAARERATHSGVRLQLVRSREAHFVFELCGMDGVLPFVDKAPGPQRDGL